MATLTGELISETYDSLLKVTDNNTITGIKKRITDGFGNDIPLLLSSTDIEIDGSLILSALTDLAPASKFLSLKADNSVGFRTSSELLSDIGGASSSSISGTTGRLSKFTSSGAVGNSILNEIGNVIHLTDGTSSYASFGIINPGVDNDCYIGSTINNDFIIRVNNTEALRIDTNFRLKIANIQNALYDTDKFLVSEDGVVKYRTGAEVLADIGGASAGSYVPYIGATSDVNLGEFGLQTGNIEFDLTPTTIPTTVGSMAWNDSSGTVDLKLKGGNVTLQIGQETVARVVNKTATNITLLESNYQVVRVTGAQGQRPKVDLAQANNDLNSTTTLGLVTETILINQEGFITTSGQVQGVNTTGSLQGETWADGDVLYLSGTIPGQITNIKPLAPIHTVIIGFVEYAHITQGKIFVKVDNGYELEELHNVSAIAPNNNEFLTYDSATLLWKPKTVSTALGYTPVPTTRTITINGTSQDLSVNRTYSVGTVTSVAALTLGTSGTDLSSTVANSTTTPVITLNVPDASATARGVITTGSQTIGGTKTFSVDTVVNGVNIGKGGGSISTNTRVGTGSLIFNTTGNYNTGFGYYSLNQNSTGSYLTALGADSGTYINSGLPNVTSTNSVYLGNDTRASANGNSNEIVIGNSARGGGSNSATLGNSSIATTILHGNTSIGYTTNPSLYKLDVNGTGRFAGALLVASGAAANATTISNNGDFVSNWIGNSTIQLLSIRNNSTAGVYINTQNSVPLFLGVSASTTGGTTANHLQIDSTGAATFSSSVTAQTLNATNSTDLLVNLTRSGVGTWGMNVTSLGNFFLNNRFGTNVFQIADAGAATFSSSVTAGGLLTNGASGASGQEALRINNDNGYIGFFNSANSVRSGYIQGNTTDLTITTSPSTPLIFGTANVEKMRITSGGNVGIGTTTPSYQLQLSTDSAAKPTSALWTIASDERIKENISPYTKGLDVLMSINPVTYDYNGLGGFKKGKGGVGIIAQEIMNILPNSVNSVKGKLKETDKEEIDILNFNGHELTYVLINAIKELNAKIIQLENK